MTIFHVLPVLGLILGLVWGLEFGSKFGSGGKVIGGIVGAAVGFVAGRLPFVLVLKVIQRNYSRKTVDELRAMLRDPEFLAPNTILLELGSRGQDLEQDLSLVLDMLVDPSRERRIRGWHALASAFPERAKLIPDYQVNDAPEECQKKIEKLRNAEPGP